MSNLNQLQSVIDNAPEEREIMWSRFGKLSVTPQVIVWSEVDGKRQPNRLAYDGKPLVAGETLELVFLVDIQEFNPSLTFVYERSVTIKKSGPRRKTDWSEIVEPSLVAVFGKDWIIHADGNYVEAQDVPTVTGRMTKNDKPLNTIKLVRSFASRAECLAAYEGIRQSSVTSDGIPADVVIWAKEVRDIADKHKLDFGALVATDERLSKYGVEALQEAMK